MIGRLDAPGAKLEPVMPGLVNKRSPSVAPPLRRISSLGTTVTVANWSVTIGSVPGSDTAGAPGPANPDGAAGARRAIGLGALTTISGSASCANIGDAKSNNDNGAALTSSEWLRDQDIIPTPKQCARSAEAVSRAPTRCRSRQSGAITRLSRQFAHESARRDGNAIAVRRWEERATGKAYDAGQAMPNLAQLPAEHCRARAVPVAAAGQN